jgi:cyclopropane-fatty-acyl-phospholipid synthase
MNDTTLIEWSRARPRVTAASALARRLVHARLARLREGRLRLHEGGQVLEFGAAGAGGAADASLTVLDPAMYAEIALGGSVGAGESYMLGHWRSDDLTAVLRLLLRNRDALDAVETGLARLSAPLRGLFHRLRANTRSGARRNIAAHYDLGNDFFELMLDETMMYSCALFERPGMTLSEASLAKLDAVCRRLDLRAGDRVLEIGTGWGGFAMHAAARYGCRVTTTTISRQQFERARERVQAAGLADRVDVLLEDYRDLGGRYDKLVSIEMIEAIGHRQYESFFARCADRLAPGGRMLLQSITIADRHYARARDEVDFIKRYVFPGCCIPSLSALAQAASDGGSLRVERVDDIGIHYAATLAAWRDNFFSQLERVHALGYPDEFIRLWDFYLSYCEAGFAERALGDVQMLLVRDR